MEWRFGTLFGSRSATLRSQRSIYGQLFLVSDQSVAGGTNVVGTSDMPAASAAHGQVRLVSSPGKVVGGIDNILQYALKECGIEVGAECSQQLSPINHGHVSCDIASENRITTGGLVFGNEGIGLMHAPASETPVAQQAPAMFLSASILHPAQSHYAGVASGVTNLASSGFDTTLLSASGRSPHSGQPSSAMLVQSMYHGADNLNTLSQNNCTGVNSVVGQLNAPSVNLVGSLQPSNCGLEFGFINPGGSNSLLLPTGSVNTAGIMPGTVLLNQQGQYLVINENGALVPYDQTAIASVSGDKYLSAAAGNQQAAGHLSLMDQQQTLINCGSGRGTLTITAKPGEMLVSGGLTPFSVSQPQVSTILNPLIGSQMIATPGPISSLTVPHAAGQGASPFFSQQSLLQSMAVPFQGILSGKCTCI